MYLVQEMYDLIRHEVTSFTGQSRT